MNINEIKQALRKRLLNEGSGGHEYGCVMLFLPIEKEWWSKLTGEIEEDDVYNPEGERDYGIQPHDEAHVTILYGIHSDVPDEDVEALIEKMTAPEVTLGKIGIFKNGDKGFDVVKFDVTGQDLHDMNKMFIELPHTNDYPDYHPHATIAYVKDGTGKKYSRNLPKDDILTVKPNKIVYSKADGTKKEYKI
jgi:2'-5' RNA ligase